MRKLHLMPKHIEPEMLPGGSLQFLAIPQLIPGDKSLDEIDREVEKRELG
jgi:hypothetical protein